MANFALQLMNGTTRRFADPANINRKLSTEQQSSSTVVGKEKSRVDITRLSSRIESQVKLRTACESCNGSFKPHHRIDSTAPANMTDEELQAYKQDFVQVVAAHWARINGGAVKGFNVDITVDAALKGVELRL